MKGWSAASRRAGRVGPLLCAFVSFWLNTHAQTRTAISLNSEWRTAANDSSQAAFNGFEKTSFNDKDWIIVDVPHNWDAYEGYRRKLHGNRHGYAWYRKTFTAKPQPANKRLFLFFEGVGSFATVWLNGIRVGYHAGGRTTFTIDVTSVVKFNAPNLLAVRADHPAYIKNLPWVCGGCSDERGFSEGSQPMGIFRPVHLIITNDVRIEPFGVHVWNDTMASEKVAVLKVETEIKNYGNRHRALFLQTRIVDKAGRTVSETSHPLKLSANGGSLFAQFPSVANPTFWSLSNPYLYKVVTEIFDGDKLVDKTETPYGIRTVKWQLGNASSKQFLLNGKPVFINGIAEYEHLLGGSHAFSEEQIRSRAKQIKAAGFNAFRDAHHPHNLRYQVYWDSLGLLWWPQLSAHVWYDTPAFREQFKANLKEWVKERRNSPSLVLWGLQNESKLPEDFAKECSDIIRQMDPTASSQRLITTCNGGGGTDWDVPQNWTGTYGGNPSTYSEDLKRQILVGEYGAWRTLDLHTEGEFVQAGPYSEERFCQLMEQKIRLGEAAKDSSAGHFMWLFTSHDNPGRVQGGECYRELDRIGPVNYKGLFTPWEEPTDAFYLYRSNYTDKHKEPMVYIVSHTWPDRWTKPGKKDGIVVYSNCDEVELFNDVRSLSLGGRKRSGIGTHFTWDGVDIQYNVLYAVGYVGGKEVARDTVLLHHLPKAPHFNELFAGVRNITAPQSAYNYLYRINCGGPAYTDNNGNGWTPDRQRVYKNEYGSTSWTNDFHGLPPYFASQRTTSDPIKGTKDWQLFQTFRYGRDKLRYEFPVQDGEYLIELYFTEPWAGTGGGMDCTGWRLFDVAVNGKTVLKDLDIWKEAGHDGALKKTVKAYVKSGLLTISFPKAAAGQAVISAIAIATKHSAAFPAYVPAPLYINRPHKIVGDSAKHPEPEVHDWLATGDEAYLPQWQKEAVRFCALPPELFGAQWTKGFEGGNIGSLTVYKEADVFFAVDTTKAKPSWASGFAQLRSFLQLSNGKTYAVFRKRSSEVTTFETEARESDFVMVQPASDIEPAYDLKPVNSYKAINTTLVGPGLKKGKVDGKDRVIFKTASVDNAIEWNFNTGVADVYSLTVSYNNPTQLSMKGTLQLLSADGTLLKEDTIEFTPTKEGKQNYILTNTGSMINAGAYKLCLRASGALGLSVNSLDVQ